ncbi:hypothetical protein [Amycolatopsis magusensis]|uniref:hypothetical protein n=1 Tax=Amycolatopsis magusensis TaxID=882444 RepID=UPI00379EA84D
MALVLVSAAFGEVETHTPAFLAACVLAEHGNPLVLREADASYLCTVLGTHVPPTAEHAARWRERCGGGDREWRVRWDHASAAVRTLLPQISGSDSLPAYDDADFHSPALAQSAPQQYGGGAGLGTVPHRRPQPGIVRSVAARLGRVRAQP